MISESAKMIWCYRIHDDLWSMCMYTCMHRLEIHNSNGSKMDLVRCAYCGKYILVTRIAAADEKTKTCI